jgi:5-methylcytosine-specific restriction endonuclease McrA
MRTLERTGNAPAAEPWQDTLRRDPCSYCGVKNPHVDHIVARSRGGEDNWTNYTAACARCNLSKHDYALSTWLGGRM